MSRWYKQDGNSDAHPKVQRAGFWGARVLETLCRVSAEFELGGRVPPHYADPSYLARRMMATDLLPLEEAEAAIAKGLKKLADPDPKWALVEVEEDGSVVILGWRGEGEGLSSTERSKNHRRVKELEAQLEAMRALVEGRQAESAAPSGATERNAPTLHATPGDEDATNRNDATLKRRGEEIREEEISPLPPTAGAAGEGDAGALTETQLAELWNAEVAEPGKGQVRIPLGKNLLRHARARLKTRPRREDWAPVFERARQLREVGGCTWLDFGWLVGGEDKADRVLGGKYDFKLEQARGAAPIPMRRPVGGIPPAPEPPPLPPPKPDEERLQRCGECGELVTGTWDGERWRLAEHFADFGETTPCITPGMNDSRAEGARSYA